jgi:hypothetical protein
MRLAKTPTIVHDRSVPPWHSASGLGDWLDRRLKLHRPLARFQISPIPYLPCAYPEGLRELERIESGGRKGCWAGGKEIL